MVETAHCNCMAGLGETCTHVAAILFYVEGLKRLKEKTTVTGKSAYWKVPPGNKKISPSKCSQIDFTNPKTQRKRLFDEVHTPVKALTKKPEGAKPTACSDRVAKFCSTLLNVPDSTHLPGILSVLKNFQKPFLPNFNVPPSLMTFRNDTYFGKSYEEVVAYCCALKIEVSPTQAQTVESQTTEQSKSKLWFEMRTGRVTASRLFKVCHTSPQNPFLSLIHSIVDPQHFKSQATEWGLKRENVAKSEYILSMSSHHSDFECLPCGLHIKFDEPFLAASPDGTVTCSCCSTGCLEIKCPWSAKDMTLVEAMKSLSLFPFSLSDNGTLILSKESSYFYQCQLQMYVTSTDYCDLVIYTKKDLLIHRLIPDLPFILHKVSIAKQFFFNVLLPEIVSKYFTHSVALQPIREKNAYQSKKKQRTK